MPEHNREAFDALVDAAPDYTGEASLDEAPITPIDLWGHFNPLEFRAGYCLE